MKTNFKKIFLLIILAILLKIPFILISNDLNINPFIRVMDYSILKDYPSFEFMEINEEDLSENTTGYSDSMIISLTALKKSDYNLEIALKGIKNESYDESLKLESLSKTKEIYNTYNLNAKFVSISFQTVVLIFLSYFILYIYDKIKKNFEKHFSSSFIIESKK